MANTKLVMHKIKHEKRERKRKSHKQLKGTGKTAMIKIYYSKQESKKRKIKLSTEKLKI